MAVQIRFDNTHNAIAPTFVLGTRSGNKLGVIPACNINMSDTFGSKFELQFEVHKFLNGEKYVLWDKLVDFAVVWCKEWDVWFEIEVTTKDSDGVVKQISCTSIGEAELSQVYLYDIEINTEDDIAREDYVPTHLYDASNHEASLLHRIMDKVPHYSIEYVESRLAPIQRTFSFDNKSLYDALQEISEEIDCLFVINSGTDSNGKIERSISVYDLESYCTVCHKRGSFDHVCTECGSTNILPCYGEDTAILISVDNLADEITYSTDTGSVKNCFRLECGDDLMTATVRNCNPNGSQYIWYISDAMKADMSDELVEKLNEYNTECITYEDTYEADFSQDTTEAYNSLIDKYDNSRTTYSNIGTLTGYAALMNAYYNTIQLEMFLRDEMMPSIETSEVTAQTELTKLSNVSIVAVQKLSSASVTTITNAVESVAKTMIDPMYKVATSNVSYNSSTNKWTGKFTVTNYSDETQTATSVSAVQITITDDYSRYVKQRVNSLARNERESKGLVGIENLFDFDVELGDFENEMTKYCLAELNNFHDACEACVNLLIQQGVADKKTIGDDVYNEVYLPFYERLNAIEAEIQTREEEIATVTAIQSEIAAHRQTVQEALNFENYLGTDLWLEFIAYRREDTYRNDNYISDGLTDAEIFECAREFITTARNEIYKSATQQHSLSASLKNLLVMKEFEPIVEKFAVGNWIRVKTNGIVYKLRLLSYSINFDQLESLSVEFSDVKIFADGITECASILNKAASMSSSYGYVTRQARKGEKGNKKIGQWVNDGLALTNMKIVNDADNQNISMDNHGMLCREYLPATDSYDAKQLKIVNRGLYVSDDNWQTAKAGIGNFEYYDPRTGEHSEGYGVIADKLIGNLVLSQEVGVYNDDASITMDPDGLTITTKPIETDGSARSVLLVQKEVSDGDEANYDPLMYVDNDGNLVLNGSIKINTDKDTNLSSIDDLADPTRITSRIDTAVENMQIQIGTAKDEAKAHAGQILDTYKTDVGQYMQFDDNGLTIGAIGSGFKTIIDNRRLAFTDQEDEVMAYITNKQLYIPNAVIQKSLWLGGYAFVPNGDDGGVSLVWQGI